jgi:hypothetical protein
MNGHVEIERALGQLPRQDKWQIARWLLQDLEKDGRAGKCSELVPAALPDYRAHRRQIFGNKVLPNMVLAAREEERW